MQFIWPNAFFNVPMFVLEHFLYIPSFQFYWYELRSDQKNGLTVVANSFLKMIIEQLIFAIVAVKYK